ncbi:MAG: DUF2723 domain-containing protein [Chloroflexi bacterium]|nr:DUF2723 domain-containing protein [Chloroflexota bacterium]
MRPATDRSGLADAPNWGAAVWLPAIFTTLAALVVYGLTLAPDLTWANHGVDGGELMTAVYTRGLPHPPGYPLYRLLGQIVVYLPFDPVAYRFNLFSAITVALAAGVLTLAAARWPLPTAARPLSAITAAAVGLTFAFSSLVWSQATITEVYGLALLLLALFLWALLTKRPSLLTGFLLGLSLTAHPTGWFMLPLALAQTPRAGWPRLLLGGLVGLLPLVLLPWLAHPASPVVWGEPTTLRGWWWLVSGQLYRGYAFALPLADLPVRLAAWLPIWLSQFTWAGIPLIAAGVWLLPRPERQQALWLGGTAVLYLLFALAYLPDDAIILALPAWLLLSLLLAPTYHKLGILALCLPLILLLVNFNEQNLRADKQPIRGRAEALLAAIPPGAVVSTPGDPTIFALWYFQHVEGQRPDVILVDENLWAFDWYRARLARLHPGLAGLEQPDAANFAALNIEERPSCRASLNTHFTIPFNLTCAEEIDS